MKKKKNKTIFQVKEAEQKTTYVEVPFEIKLLDDKDDGYFRFEGLASTFDNIDLVDDIIERGCFTDSLKEFTPIILWQHETDEPIGMPDIVQENNDGLYTLVRLPKDDTLVSGRVIPQMRVGSIKTMSIGFRVVEYFIDQEGIRHLVKVILKEISLVTFPANPLAVVTGFKGEELEIVDVEKAKLVTTKRDFEKCLRESGVFTKDASCILAKFFQGELEETDATEDEDEDINAKAEHDMIQNAFKGLSSKINNDDLNTLLKNMSKKLEYQYV